MKLTILLFEVNVTLILENIYPDGNMAEKGTNGGPWLIGLRSVCEVNVILDLRSGSRHEK